MNQAVTIQIFLSATLFVLICQAQGDNSSDEVVTSCAKNSNAEIFSSSVRVKRWVHQPNFRGTFDILWTCLVTIFISTYSMLCLNVPAPKDSFAMRFGRRLLWMALGILGPEFPLTYAAGQWSRAKHSIEAFRRSGYEDWDMRRAFFADMGGFVFQAVDGQPFPLNAT